MKIPSAARRVTRLFAEAESSPDRETRKARLKDALEAWAALPAEDRRRMPLQITGAPEHLAMILHLNNPNKPTPS